MYVGLIGSMDFGGTTINETPDNLFPFNTGNPGEGAPGLLGFNSSLSCNCPKITDSVGTQAHLSGHKQILI